MAGIKYSVEKTNQSVSDMYTVSEKLPLLADSIKASTNKILSARGFKTYVGGLDSNLMSSSVVDCYQDTSNLLKEIKQTEIEILAYSEDKNSINQFLDSLTNKDYRELDLSSLDSYITFDRSLKNTVVGGLSLFASLGLGIAEGLGTLIETAADVVCMGVSGAASIFLLGYDALTGENTTQELWENTKAHVAEKKTKSLFDQLFTEVPEIKQMADNTLFVSGDKVRSVGSGLGYGAGILAVGALTGGAALPAVAGTLGISKGAEQAWSEGGTLEQGLKYGIANGIFDAAKWEVGVGISKLAGGIGSVSASGIFGANTGAVLRTTLVAADAGGSEIIRPALTTIYKDYGGETFAENYQKAFEAAGGWNNVLINAGVGAALNTAGEVFMRHKLTTNNQKQNERLNRYEGESAEKTNREKVFKSFEEEYPEYASKVKGSDGKIKVESIEAQDLKGFNEYERANAQYKAESLGLNMQNDPNATALLMTKGFKEDIKDYLKIVGYKGDIDTMADTIASKLFASHNMSKIKATSLVFEGKYDDIPALLGHTGIGKEALTDTTLLSELFRGTEAYNTSAVTREVTFKMYDDLVRQYGVMPNEASESIKNGLEFGIERRGFDQYEVKVGDSTVTVYRQKDFRNSSQNKVTVEDILDRIDSLPEGVKEKTRIIYEYDTYSPDDIYHTFNSNSSHTKFGYNGNRRFESAMAFDARNQSITIYNPADNADSVIHEMGHLIDNEMGITTINQSSWKNAMDADYTISRKHNPTSYAEHTVGEDFAESFEKYFTDYDHFRKNYPNRAALIKAYLDLLK